jgi:hypothetical protein
MASKKSYEDKISAVNKSIGFDYQYYYFLLQLLNIRHGQKVGLEVKDDVHVELPNGTIKLIQLKHSVQKNANGEIKNLTERSIDMWKSIHNWIGITKDPIMNRKKIKDQIIFLKNTEYILVTNKSDSLHNNFFIKLREFQSSNDLPPFKKYLTDLHDNTAKAETTEEDGVKDYINELNSQSDNFLQEFLKQISFELNVEEIIDMIRKRLHEFMIKENKIDDVFNCLDSNLRKNIFLDVKSDKKIELTYEQFSHSYRLCFEKGRSEKLLIRRYEHTIPVDPEKQIFIKQLLEIGGLTSDYESIAKFTQHKLHALNNLEEWIQKGELSEEERETFRKNCIMKWELEFTKAYREVNRKISKGLEVAEDDIINSALKCLDEIRGMELKLAENNFELDMSNGKFYLLSDEPVIGWHLKWEKYKK